MGARDRSRSRNGPNLEIKIKETIPLLSSTSQATSRMEIVQLCLKTRFLFFLAMIVSSFILPTFDPGHGVLQFDMRLGHKERNSSTICFCLKGHVCNEDLWTEGSSLIHEKNTSVCVVGDHQRYVAISSKKIDFYDLLLTPLTRWDAARFLTLAISSKARYPPIHLRKQCELKRDNSLEKSCSIDDESLFESSERAHAFFPFFPLCIRFLALLLAKILPTFIMPPTFEALVVLSSLLWNTMCFILAALAIQELTYAILLYSQKETYQESERKTVLSLANMTAVAFVLNPANVFFISCYSETTFSCMTFTGYALFTHAFHSGNNLLYVVSTILFMLASYTRSNGSLIAIFIFIHLSAKMLIVIKDKKGLVDRFRCCLGYLLLYTPQMILIITPIYYHEKRGIAFHCDQDYRPTWCDTLDQSTSNFSLYGYVQNKHWNVGLFRYWTLAQIPNFILASPILCLGILGVTCWIKASVNKYRSRLSHHKDISTMVAIKWAFNAVQSISIQDEGKKENNRDIKEADTLLAHYAILGGFTLLGLFIAHVQISTRMICSACPSLYWVVVGFHEYKGKDSRKELLYYYFIVFYILSIVMHVNWLPWT